MTCASETGDQRGPGRAHDLTSVAATSGAPGPILVDRDGVETPYRGQESGTRSHAEDGRVKEGGSCRRLLRSFRRGRESDPRALVAMSPLQWPLGSAGNSNGSSPPRREFGLLTGGSP